MIEIRYENNTPIQANAEDTILETSLKNGLEHMHACGGKARCSTCRVLVLDGLENLEPRNEQERSLSRRRGLESNVRLACQTHPRGPVHIRRLVLDDADYVAVRERAVRTTGREENVAILFSDIRNFTSFSEKNLPYDVIHLLNRYFEAMGEVVLSNGGIIDKYIGDGLMATFGLKEADPVSICIRAVNAGLEMLTKLEEVNSYARKHLDYSLRIGIGIHYGSVVVGELGHHSNASFTLIGDSVNMAARLESKTKKAGASLLVSDAVYEHIKPHVSKGRTFRAPLKGKTGEFLIYEIKSLNRDTACNLIDQLFMLTLDSIEVKARGSFLFRFDRPSNFKFHAGQSIEIRFPRDSRTESRTFSVASAEQDPHLDIVTRDTGSDFKKRMLEMKPGDQVIASAAGGLLQLPENPTESIVFLAAGIGITPLYSMIRTLSTKKAQGENVPGLLLIASNRNYDSFLFHSELLHLSQTPGFFYVPTLTGDLPGDWHEEIGRIDPEMIRRHQVDPEKSDYYLAGPPTAVRDLSDTLRSMGVLPERIHTEEFYGYQ
ncbi:MAG: 2Fe-2S iron-sulfur cluster binding domain-containing protein [Leptospiraceae bacterium]|nr:2Fe-2S iron-sulfur cluster binding domain-containing protein [Leptospiraceae bacterium]